MRNIDALRSISTLRNDPTNKIITKERVQRWTLGNGLLQKSIESKQGAQSYTQRASVIALCFSVGECASEVWGRSACIKEIDTASRDAGRVATGRLTNHNSRKSVLIGSRNASFNETIKRHKLRETQTENWCHLFCVWTEYNNRFVRLKPKSLVP